MITTTLCFELRALKSSIAADFAQKIVRFQPKIYDINGIEKEFIDWEQFHKDARKEESSSFYLTAEDGCGDPSFSLAPLRGWQMQTLTWTQELDREEGMGTILKLIELDSFHSGFSALEEHLARSTKFGRNHKESTEFPGRQSLYPGMWLAAGWKNWFGPWARRILDFEKVVSFRPAYVTDPHIIPGGIFVHLTNDPSEPALTDIQRRFWIETGLQDLEASVNGL